MNAIQQYYDVLNSAKGEMHHFYHGSAVVVWNGFPVPPSELPTFFAAQLLSASFNPTTVDAQPVPGVSPGADGQECLSNILVTVAGEVEYSKSVSRSFTQSFLLVQDVQKPKSFFVIASDTYREVAQ